MRRKNQFLKLLLKVLLGITLAIVLTIGVLLIDASVKHKSKLKEEEKYMVYPGKMVNVDGRNIHVMHEGNEESEYTLVFLHSNKVIDDSVVLQPLFKELKDYELVYIDRSGYGFSDDSDVSKDLESMVYETRTALKQVADREKYILVASKSAGLEAIYWSFAYPDEVQAIIGLEMYFPDEYTELKDNNYCSLGNRLLVKLVSIGAHRYAKNIYPTNEDSLYTDMQMKTRSALVSKSLYTQGMYNEDAEVVKNGKALYDKGWPEDVKMYLLYANPFMKPYVDENERVQEVYNQVVEYGEEYDPVTSYNDYYRTYLAAYKNVTVEEISGPERLITYNPSALAEKITQYIETLN